jgi:hypothetical protein
MILPAKLQKALKRMAGRKPWGRSMRYAMGKEETRKKIAP